jgi:hypothetical protein
MMKNRDKLQNQIIDEYYGEALKSCLSTEDNFADDMENTLAKMNVIKDLDYPLDINILEIIAKAEVIRDRRKFKFEAAGFILVCLITASILGTLLFHTGPKIYLYIQAAISAVMPLIVIPIAINCKSRGEA